MKLSFHLLLVIHLGIGCLPAHAIDLDAALIGEWPRSVNGSVNSVALQGQYAYCTVISENIGATPGLVIFDVSTPTNPAPLTFYETGDDPKDVFVVSNHAYLAVAERLAVLDVSNPAAPREVGSYTGLVMDPVLLGLFVTGNHAFVADGALRIIDVSDPTTPRQVAIHHAGLGAGFRDVVVSGNYAYVAEAPTAVYGDGRLRVYDVSNPAAARLVGSTSQIGPANSVSVSGSHAYVVTAGRNLHVIDVGNPANPQLVGTYADVGPTGVAVSGTYVYVGERFTGLTTSGGLQVIDAGNPATPQSVGQYHAAGRTFGLAHSGNHAFVAAGDAGLRIVDVSNPALPKGAGGYDCSPFGHPAGLIVAGSHAYVAVPETGLKIMDVSNPIHPLPLAALETEGIASGVAISGHRAYLAESPRWDGAGLVGGGLHVIDISNPANPLRVSSYGHGSSFGRVFASGNHAYVEVPGEGLRMIDVSDPANPRLRGSYAASSVCLVHGDHAYVTGLSADVVEIVDVSDAGNPRRAGVYVPAGGVYLMTVLVSGNYAYLAAPGNDLEVVDVSDPSNPRLSSRYNTTPTEVIGTSLAISGTRVCIGHDWVINRLGFEVVDVTDPANPRKVGGYHDEDVGRLFLVSNHAYRVHSTFKVIDVGRPANPQRVGDYPLTGSIQRGGVAVSSNRAFVADGTNGLQVLDVSNPASPQRIGGYNTPGSAEDVFVSGNLAFVADWQGGLRIIAVGNPGNPLLVATLALPDTVVGIPEVAERVVVSGQYAYVTGYELHVVDVSNPARPVRVGGAQPPNGNLGLFVSGRYVYLVNAGLHIYDVINPASPQRVGGVNTGLNSYDVFVSGDYAYVADEVTGLHVVDVSDPANPQRVGGYTLDFACSVAVSGNHAYVISRNSGLNVLDVSAPAQPRRVGGNTAVGGIVSYGGAADLAAVDGKVYAFARGRGLFVLNLFEALRLEPMPPQPSAFRFQLRGPQGLTGWIQRSTNLRDWTNWQTFTLGPVVLEVVDPATLSGGQQFYRAVSR